MPGLISGRITLTPADALALPVAVAVHFHRPYSDFVAPERPVQDNMIFAPALREG
jgi:hypothetical protein